MMWIRTRSAFLLLCFFIVHSQYSDAANLGLASYYSDHMVLQMEPNSAVIWGYAESGASISVTFKDKVYKAVPEPVSYSSSPVWRVILDPTPPSGPFDITIQSINRESISETIILNDVLFGDVWICSGQSNMAFNVPKVFNASEVVKDSTKYKNIRLLAITQTNATQPYYDVKSLYETWSLPSAETLGADPQNFFLYFSAVCYLFGVELHQHLGYPIGLISDNWGGTPIQAWSSPEVVNACPGARQGVKSSFTNHSKPVDLLDKLEAYGPQDDSVLWNAMIHPMLNFTIKGALWYQGEANTKEPPELYACLFPKMINDWRKKWFDGTGGNTDPAFPFGFVQLCTSNVPFNDTSYPPHRWAQTVNYGYVPNPSMPNVFMAVSIDLPDPDSPYDAIHPRDKQDVAHRLSLGARAVAYKETYTKYQGPFPKQICSLTENKVIVDYKFDDIKLVSADIFEVCCSDTNTCSYDEDAWQSVEIINQINATSLMLGYQCPGETIGTNLRYIWLDMPCQFKECALYGDGTNLPGPPFNIPINITCS